MNITEVIVTEAKIPLEGYKTLLGIPATKIKDLLAAPFADGDKAYRGVPGGADLTDINTGHMIERITDVFGPRGLGWMLEYKPEDMVIIGEGKRVTAHLKYAEFKYLLIEPDGQKIVVSIPVSGASTNDFTYAEEGARTSALGAGLKSLCFQLPLYKGYLDHHNAKTVKAPSGNGSEEQIPEDRTKEAFASWALSTYGLSGKQTKLILMNAGVKTYDWKKWDQYQKIVIEGAEAAREVAPA